ncbi:DUF7544 domain-containing protein [Halobaculum marinum]|uniref:Membrane domain of glycerophosphoryl diester phosphodiesterase n=1 Tax=Halobaculum marinum TaxID=3031996 RepID=A0ABD5X498_9EURY|nr:hypothetical protein [Halobaculum sp. DT55]
MSWHGVDAVDDAIDVTREFLFPARLGRWARMAVVSLFTSGGGGTAQIASNAGRLGAQFAGSGGVPSSPGSAAAVASLLVALPALAFAAAPTLGPLPAPLQQGVPTPGPGALGIVGFLIAAFLLLLVLALVLISPAFQFVLVDAIARDDLRLRRDVRAHFVNGLRLLGFQIGLAAAFIVPPAAIVAGAILSGTSADAVASSPLALVGIAAVVVVYVLAFAFLSRFTVEFVVPAMVADGGGVIDGWRRIWSLLRGQLMQTVVYIVMHWLVGIGISIVSLVLTLLGMVVVGVIAGVVGLAVGALAGGATGTDLGVGVGFLAGTLVGVPLFVVAVAAPVSVLTLTVKRSYELAALGRFSERLNLVDRYREHGDDGGDVESALRTGADADDENDDHDDDGGSASLGDSGEDDGDDGDDGDDFGGFVASGVEDDDPDAPTEDDGAAADDRDRRNE